MTNKGYQVVFRRCCIRVGSGSCTMVFDLFLLKSLVIIPYFSDFVSIKVRNLVPFRVID